MRAEGHAFFADLAQIAQAEDLEAARVGEDGARPGHEKMQTAKLADQVDSGPEVKMIGIAEQDLDAESFEHILRHAFDGGLRTDRHENGRFNGAVWRVQGSTSRGSAQFADLKSQRHVARF